MTNFSMKAPCKECPWLVSSPIGKFPPSRYLALADTCKPGGMRHVFACHMTPEGEERACAGMMVVCGEDSNQVRLAAMRGLVDLNEIKISADTYPSYRALAVANGCDPDAPEFEGLPE